MGQENVTTFPRILPDNAFFMNIVILVSLFHNCVFSVFLNIDKMHNNNAQYYIIIFTSVSGLT